MRVTKLGIVVASVAGLAYSQTEAVSRKLAPTLLAQAAAAPAQSPPKPLTFDAASVKSVSMSGVRFIDGNVMVPKGSGFAAPTNTGGPGTSDPGRIHYSPITLKQLLGRAYDSYSEIKGPVWLDNELVQLDATMPPKTTKEQFREMLGNLMVNRFKLEYHVQNNQVNGYSLVVARNGLKMKESVEAPDAQAQDNNISGRLSRSRRTGSDGFPLVAQHAGPSFAFQVIPGDRARMVGRQETMQDLAEALGTMLKSTVVDATGLKGKYDFSVTFAGHPGHGGIDPSEPTNASDAAALPDIFSALQSDLGLKLESRKVTVQVMVIDHMEKIPAGN